MDPLHHAIFKKVSKLAKGGWGGDFYMQKQCNLRDIPVSKNNALCVTFLHTKTLTLYVTFLYPKNNTLCVTFLYLKFTVYYRYL